MEDNPLNYHDEHGDCPQLARMVKDVYAQIPSKHRDEIESVCADIYFIHTPREPWIGGPYEAAFSFLDRWMLIVIERMYDFSVSAQRGIIAHEFGHAYDRAVRGFDETKAMDPRERQRAEDHADAYAIAWDFTEEIRQRNQEMQPHV